MKKKNLKSSLENLSFDIFKEPYKKREGSSGKKVKKKGKGKKVKVTSDEGFDELESKYNDSDTSTTESQSSTRKINDKSKLVCKFKNPFQGYLFKEDIETLQKTYAVSDRKNDSGKIIRSEMPKKNYLIKNSLLMNGEVKNNVEEEKIKNNAADCLCYDNLGKLKYNNNFESETLTFIKAKEDFKKQMNFTGMIYR